MNDEEFKKQFRKHLAFKPGNQRRLVKEGTTWENRKTGEPLPTMRDYKEAYESKNPKLNEYREGFVTALPKAEAIFDKIDGIIDLMETQEEELEFLANIFEYTRQRAEDVKKYM